MNDRVTLLDTDEVLFEVEILEGKPFLHLQLHKWSVGYYKRYKVIFEGIKKHLRDKGHAFMYVLIPSNDPKLLRFETMFGFTLYKQIADLYLLRQET